MHTELEMMGEASRGHTDKSALIYEAFLKKVGNELMYAFILHPFGNNTYSTDFTSMCFIYFKKK